MKFIKINGAIRTGSNYLEWLLRKNFPNDHVFYESNITGWKHGCIPNRIDWTGQDWEEQGIPNRNEIIQKYLDIAAPLRHSIQSAFNARQILYFVTVKHPLQWYAGATRYLSRPAVPLQRDIIHEWNVKYRHWCNCIEREPHRMQIVKYEDLTANYSDYLKQIGKRHGLIHDSQIINLTEEITHRQTLMGADFKNHKHQERVQAIKAEKRLFDALIDRRIAHRLGYFL